MAVLKYLNEKDRKKIDEQCTRMCDKFCKYPALWDEETKGAIIDEVCPDCPIDMIRQIAGCDE